MSETALIYLPDSDDSERWLQSCMEHVGRHGYQLVAVVRDGWDGVWSLLADGVAQVVVIGTRAYLDPERTPRVEVVVEEGPAPTPRQRRPRLIRRDGAA